MKHLAISIDAQQVRFDCLVDKDVTQNLILDFSSENLENQVEEIDTFLNSNDSLNVAWDAITLSWFNSKSTLLPESIFKACDIHQPYKLAFGDLTEGLELKYDRIPNVDIINIYSTPALFRTYFIRKFLTIQFLHEGSHFIGFNSTRKIENHQLVIAQHNSEYMLMAFEKGNLVYYNFFDQKNPEDLLYHTAHLIQKLKWESPEIKAHFYSLLEEGKTTYSTFTEMCSNISIFKNTTWSYHKNWRSKIQQACV